MSIIFSNEPSALHAPANRAMTLIRSLLFVLYQIVTVIPWALLCLLWAPLPRPLRYRLTIVWCRLAMFGSRWLLGIKPNVIGAQNLPDRPVILLSKHQSTWETLFYPTWFRRELCFVFKRELLYLPFFGWGIGLLDMIHINRRKGRDAFEQVVEQGAVKLGQGRWIIMFPEGTRTPVGVHGRYKTGGTRLAIRCGVDVVPIAVNSGQYWPKKPFTKRPGVVTVSIGAPLVSSGKTPEQLNDEVEQWIETEMRRLNPEHYVGARHESAAVQGS